MRKGILRLSVLLILNLILGYSSFSLSIVRKANTENPISPVNSNYLRAAVFITLSVKQFETATGKKLNLPQKIRFKIVQQRLRHELKNDPDLLITNYYDPKKAKFKLDALWIVIASFIGPLGLLAAYTSKQRKGAPTKRVKITSAWIGCAIFILWFGFAFIF